MLYLNFSVLHKDVRWYYYVLSLPDVEKTPNIKFCMARSLFHSETLVFHVCSLGCFTCLFGTVPHQCSRLTFISFCLVTSALLQSEFAGMTFATSTHPSPELRSQGTSSNTCGLSFGLVSPFSNLVLHSLALQLLPCVSPPVCTVLALSWGSGRRENKGLRQPSQAKESWLHFLVACVLLSVCLCQNGWVTFQKLGVKELNLFKKIQVTGEKRQVAFSVQE